MNRSSRESLDVHDRPAGEPWQPVCSCRFAPTHRRRATVASAVRKMHRVALRQQPVLVDLQRTLHREPESTSRIAIGWRFFSCRRLQRVEPWSWADNFLRPPGVAITYRRTSMPVRRRVAAAWSASSSASLADCKISGRTRTNIAVSLRSSFTLLNAEPT
jgi:hypothetical protein